MEDVSVKVKFDTAEADQQIANYGKRIGHVNALEKAARGSVLEIEKKRTDLLDRSTKKVGNTQLRKETKNNMKLLRGSFKKTTLAISRMPNEITRKFKSSISTIGKSLGQMTTTFAAKAKTAMKGVGKEVGGMAKSKLGMAAAGATIFGTAYKLLTKGIENADRQLELQAMLSENMARIPALFREGKGGEKTSFAKRMIGGLTDISKGGLDEASATKAFADVLTLLKGTSSGSTSDKELMVASRDMIKSALDVGANMNKAPTEILMTMMQMLGGSSEVTNPLGFITKVETLKEVALKDLEKNFELNGKSAKQTFAALGQFDKEALFTRARAKIWQEKIKELYPDAAQRESVSVEDFIKLSDKVNRSGIKSLTKDEKAQYDDQASFAVALNMQEMIDNQRNIALSKLSKITGATIAEVGQSMKRKKTDIEVMDKAATQGVGALNATELDVFNKLRKEAEGQESIKETQIKLSEFITKFMEEGFAAIESLVESVKKISEAFGKIKKFSFFK